MRSPEHLNLPAVVVLFWQIGAVTRLFARQQRFALMKATMSWPLFRRQLLTPNLDCLGPAPGARCFGVDQAEYVSGALTMTSPRSAHDPLPSSQQTPEVVASPVMPAPAGAGAAESLSAETLAASVVLPTHGRRASLLRVLRALGRQSMPMGTFEVVVICDGDVDGSVAACRELAAAVPYPLRVIEQVNQGPAAARNRGVMEARAPLVVFLDDDVVPDEALIATHMAAQHGQERLVTIGPLLPPTDFHLNAWAAWEERALCQQYDAMVAGRWGATYRQFYTGNAAVSRSNILDAGAFDRRYRRAEDVEFALRLRDHGLAFAFLPQARGWHYVQRSFTSWQQMAMAYGQADVAMSEDGFREVLAIVTEEFPRRNRVVRMVTHLCVGRPALTKTVLKALGVLVQLGDKLRIASINYALCSVIFNLSYYSGLAKALGGREAFERLVLNPRSGHGPHKAP